MKEFYTDQVFRKSTLATISQANEIIEQYQADGFTLTLRQLYYQFVSKALIPNTEKQYKRLGSILADGRMAGLIDWSAIEDRTRELKSLDHWNNPGEIIRAAAEGYALDHWEDQEYRPEVWIEKQALTGVISDICRKLDIGYFACKGYVSMSEMWRAAQRFQWEYGGQTAVIIYLGDHDPSGLDMDMDIKKRQRTFGSEIEFIRIALTMAQVEKYNPPPNPAKLSDSRAPDYCRKYGDESWELDALDPHTIADLIESTVLKYRDQELLDEVLVRERDHRRILKRVENEWQTL